MDRVILLMTLLLAIAFGFATRDVPEAVIVGLMMLLMTQLAFEAGRTARS